MPVRPLADHCPHRRPRDRRFASPCRPALSRPRHTIEDGCGIGARVVVLPGLTIGRGCVIGAGAVVTRDCAPAGCTSELPPSGCATSPSSRVAPVRSPPGPDLPVASSG
ncbi:MAG: DapH/DapD/GlmU-related protein [Solirubrobacteraceae bacterium]